MKLYERWSEDRQVFIKHVADITELTQRFEGQLKRFTEIDTAFRQRLGEFLREEVAKNAKAVGEMVGTSVSAAATQQVALVTETLTRTVEATQHTLANQVEVINQLKWSFWAVVFLVSLCGGLSGGYLMKHFMVKPAALTQSQQETLSAGSFLQSLWPKLSKKEQARLLAIEQGKKVTLLKKRSEDTEVTETETIDH